MTDCWVVMWYPCIRDVYKRQLLDLTLDLFDLVVTFGGPVGENSVLQQLLGNSAGTLGLFTAGL